MVLDSPPGTSPDIPYSIDLSSHLIPSLPPSIYYIPSLLSPTQQSSILSSLPANRWTTLSHRRLQAHPSPLSPSSTLLSSPLPVYLTDPILPIVKQLGIFATSPHLAPNHCLVNEYAPGQGIMPHEDGPAYYPCTATFSLGGSIVLDITCKTTGRKWRVLQEPGSLLVTTGEVYGSTLHGIAEVEVDEDLGPETVANWSLLGNREKIVRDGGRNVRTLRTSLTYRDVIKVSDAGRRILGFGRK